MPRRDAISEKKKERLMQEQENLQKLMFDARSSIRRSSLNEMQNMERENSIYPPLGNRNEKIQSENAGNDPDPDDVLWPELNHENQKANLETEEPIIYKEPFVPKPVSGNGPLREEEDTVNVVPKKTSTIRIILPEENVAAPITISEEKKTPEQSFSSQSPDTEPPVIEEATPVTEKYPWEAAELKKKKTQKIKSVAIVMVALLAGLGGYYFFSQYSIGDEVGTKKMASPTIAVSVPQAVLDTTSEKHGDLKNLDKPVAQKTNSPATTASLKENKTTVKAPGVVTKKTSLPDVAPASKEQYKVASKAYFYNEPNESTRRKAFIIHWNNAVLTPLEEKNGFVYIVFTNHLGQTSKGWLRKKDLTKLK